MKTKMLDSIAYAIYSFIPIIPPPGIEVDQCMISPKDRAISDEGRAAWRETAQVAILAYLEWQKQELTPRED